MSDLTTPNYLAEHIQIKVNFVVPEFAVASDYNLWSQTLTEQKYWDSIDAVTEYDLLSEQEQLFIKSILQSFRLLCELAKLPIFDSPRLISVSKEVSPSRAFALELRLLKIDFIPLGVFQTLLNASIELCHWMAQNQLTPKNKTAVFNAIVTKLIKPLCGIISARKSTIPVLRMAHQRGIPFFHLGLGTYQLGWGSKARLLAGSISESDSVVGSVLSTSKSAAARMLRIGGLPAPEHAVTNTVDQAQVAANRLGFPIVVKPDDQDRGLGVTVDVSNPDELSTAFLLAQKYSKKGVVLVERQADGICHRVFIANGKVLYVVKRLPMSLIGNGIQTVMDLYKEEQSKQSQKPPWLRSPLAPLDPLAIESITKAGFNLDSIPEMGQLVPLRRIESTKWGGVDEDLTHVIHHENMDIAIRAAQLFHLSHAGIDLITTDISQPWYKTGAIINEVNIAPLLGGGEISRSYLPQFFADFIEGDGKIPIKEFKTEKSALTYQKKMKAQGIRCFITSESQTKDDSGKEIFMPFKTIEQRIKILIVRADVDSIAVIK